ncbi:MAG: response regulator [Candidatus Saccharibacteria bacterium]
MTKIMLVEDDKSLREIYGVRLQAEGYEIKSAGDGEEALAMAIKERPDLIISDVMMPKISGFDMLDIIRSTPETKDIKVIMMTALSSEDQRARGETLGANRYLVKSQVGIEDVVRTVHDLLNDSPSSAPAANTFSAPTSQPAAAPTMPPVPVVVEPAPAPAPIPTPAPVATSIPAPVALAPVPEQAPVTPMPAVAAPIETAPDPSAPYVAMPRPTAPLTQPPVEAFAPAPVMPAPPTSAPEPILMPPVPEVQPIPAPEMPTVEPKVFEQPFVAPASLQPTQAPNMATMMNQELSDNSQNPQTPPQI